MRESSYNPSSACDPRGRLASTSSPALSPYSRIFYPQVLVPQDFARVRRYLIPQTFSPEYFTEHVQKNVAEISQSRDTSSATRQSFYAPVTRRVKIHPTMVGTFALPRKLWQSRTFLRLWILNVDGGFHEAPRTIESASSRELLRSHRPISTRDFSSLSSGITR